MGGTSAWLSLCALAALGATASAPARAQQGERSDTVAQDALDAITQPLSDLNLRKREIPDALVRAQEAPYALDESADCDALRGEIVALENVLGPDADASPEAEGLVNKGLQMGGDALSGFIPFRGFVRQLSGAQAERNRLESAIYAGVARRSYLKGYARARGCASIEKHAISSAEDLLGLATTNSRSDTLEGDGRSEAEAATPD